jgi:hypothetical protein
MVYLPDSLNSESVKKSLQGTILIFLFASFCAAQSIKIVPKTIIYKRLNVDANDALGMKEFSIMYPKILSDNGSKIEAVLSYEKLFEFNIEKEINAERGIRKLEYKTLFNSENILSIKLSLDTYTFSDLHDVKFITLNTKTAEIIKPAEVFKNLNQLAKSCKKSRLKSINAVKRRYSRKDYGTLFDNIKFTTEELKGFTVENRGITFHYPYTFVRTAIMFEPNNDYFFSWKQLKPYLKTDGLFARFAR